MALIDEQEARRRASFSSGEKEVLSGSAPFSSLKSVVEKRSAKEADSRAYLSSSSHSDRDLSEREAVRETFDLPSWEGRIKDLSDSESFKVDEGRAPAEKGGVGLGKGRSFLLGGKKCPYLNGLEHNLGAEPESSGTCS